MDRADLQSRGQGGSPRGVFLLPPQRAEIRCPCLVEGSLPTSEDARTPQCRFSSPCCKPGCCAHVSEDRKWGEAASRITQAICPQSASEVHRSPLCCGWVGPSGHPPRPMCPVCGAAAGPSARPAKQPRRGASLRGTANELKQAPASSCPACGWEAPITAHDGALASPRRPGRLGLGFQRVVEIATALRSTRRNLGFEVRDLDLNPDSIT